MAQCASCHGGEPGHVLGFSAVQQPHAPPELLTAAPARHCRVPGDAKTAAAFGYLHANCGHCHNPNGSARPDTDLDLRLLVAARVPSETAAYRTAVGRPLQRWHSATAGLRIAPGDAAHSGLLLRMSAADPTARMPPLGVRAIDEEGIARVRAWIANL